MNKVWQTCEANRCLTRVSYLPEMRINNQFTSSGFQVTHEPVKLSTKTRRTKSSIEYDILSMITEQSGSVASCFSLPCISPSAAMKNKRFSIINGHVKKRSWCDSKSVTYVHWDRYPQSLRHLRLACLANHESADPRFESRP